jgi:hypothetical protein
MEESNEEYDFKALEQVSTTILEGLRYDEQTRP